MLKSKTVLLITISLLLNLPVIAVSREGNEAVEEEAIKQVIEDYFNGWRNDDVESIKKAFHPHALWYSLSVKNSLVEIPQPKVYAALKDNAKRQVPKKKIVTRIISIDVSGDAASAKVEMSYPEALPYVSTKTTEYLSLVKFGEGWKIVSKVTSVEQKGPMPNKMSR